VKKFLIVVLIFMCWHPAYADLAVTLPWTMDFDNNEWVEDLALDECSGTSTHVTSGCFGGGCMKVTPPTSTCTGGGINGGQTGLGWVNYSTTSTYHVRFLIKFGSNYLATMSNNGGGTGTKFILQDSPNRRGVMGFDKTSNDGTYMTFGVWTEGSVLRYRTAPNRGWIEDARLRIGLNNAYIGEWICLEYFIDLTNDITGLYVWTQDGVFNGEYGGDGSTPEVQGMSYSTGGTNDMTGFYMSYFNGYNANQTSDTYYMIDNMQVSTSFIGPPAGFVGGTTPTVTGCTLSGASMQ
jgi:hypothetical protein